MSSPFSSHGRKTKLKLLSILFFTFLLSCFPYLKYIPKISLVEMLDFTKYAKNGFLFTPNGYIGDYESIGIIQAVFMPSATLKALKKKTSEGMVTVKHYWKKEKIETSEVLDTIYDMAKNMGANAIINFKIEKISEAYNLNTYYPVVIYGFAVEGFAIKRMTNNNPEKQIDKDSINMIPGDSTVPAENVDPSVDQE